MSMKMHCDGCDAVVQDLGKPEQFKGVRLEDPALRNVNFERREPWAFCDWNCVVIWAKRKVATSLAVQ